MCTLSTIVRVAARCGCALEGVQWSTLKPNEASVNLVCHNDAVQSWRVLVQLRKTILEGAVPSGSCSKLVHNGQLRERCA